MDKLTLNNICGGAANEVFNRSLRELVKNIKDPNTPADAARKITLEFTFDPYNDRSGAEVSFKCNSKTASVQSIKGTIFMSAAEGEMAAYPKDPRQDALFSEPAVGGKQ